PLHTPPSPLRSGRSLFSRISRASVPSSIRSSLVITPMVLRPTHSHTHTHTHTHTLTQTHTHTHTLSLLLSLSSEKWHKLWQLLPVRWMSMSLIEVFISRIGVFLDRKS